MLLDGARRVEGLVLSPPSVIARRDRIPSEKPNSPTVFAAPNGVRPSLVTLDPSVVFPTRKYLFDGPASSDEGTEYTELVI